MCMTLTFQLTMQEGTAQTLFYLICPTKTYTLRKKEELDLRGMDRPVNAGVGHGENPQEGSRGGSSEGWATSRGLNKGSGLVFSSCSSPEYPDAITQMRLFLVMFVLLQQLSLAKRLSRVRSHALHNALISLMV